MDLTDSTVLVTGGGSGIGAGLASALHAAGNRVVIAGRRRAPLRDMVAAHPGMEYLQFDQGDTASVAELADEVARRYPDLGVLAHNAATVAFDDPTAPDLDAVTTAVAANLLGPILLTGALLPTLRARDRAAVVSVTSALAYVPMAAASTYCATKAALHSYTESLRITLRGSSVRVIEIVPPRVASRDGAGVDPDAMPLDDFVSEVVDQLRGGATEIVVPQARSLREAERNGRYSDVLAVVNSEKGTS